MQKYGNLQSFLQSALFNREIYKSRMCYDIRENFYFVYVLMEESLSLIYEEFCRENFWKKYSIFCIEF
jgi:hypothetical protein